MINSGFINERDFVEQINKKTISETTPYIQTVLRKAFLEISDEQVLFADFANCYSKPDITIWNGRKCSNWSLKYGSADGVHCENLKSFILFLRGCGLSVKGQKTLLYYLNGDGTLDGTGKVTLPASKLAVKYKNEIVELNKELNNSLIKEKCIDRFLIQGREGRRTYMDFLLYGSINEGLYASKEELKEYLMTYKFLNFRVPHVGPLTIQPYVRFKKKKYYKENSYPKVQIKWKNMYADLERIRFGYNKKEITSEFEYQVNRRIIKNK